MVTSADEHVTWSLGCGSISLQNLRDSQRDVSEHRGSMAMEPYCNENEYLHRKVQVEGIHVGCLPSAAVAVLGGEGGYLGVGCLSGGVWPGGVCPGGCLPRGCLLRGVYPVEGVSTQWRGCLPRGCMPPEPRGRQLPPPPCRQNDRRL